MRPTMNKVGRTVRGVRMGCHALRRCCLNAVLAGFLCVNGFFSLMMLPESLPPWADPSRSAVEMPPCGLGLAAPASVAPREARLKMAMCGV